MLLDNGRTTALADEVGRQALHCIRCSACLNVCPVYERTGGHAYGSTYPGPIGAILTPLLIDLEQGPTLPYASSLCGACYEVCPVKIDIPRVLVHLRGRVVREGAHPEPGERLAMGALARLFAHRAPTRPRSGSARASPRRCAARPAHHPPARTAARVDRGARPAVAAAELPRLVGPRPGAA